MFRLSRRRGSTLWQVRKRWPSDVAAILSGEFNRSTGEADRKNAEMRLPAIAAEYQARVAEARRRLADTRFRDLSEAEIERLAARFYAEALPRYRITRPLSPDRRQQLLRDTQEQIRTLAESVAANDPAPVAAIARNLIERERLPVPDDSASLATLQLLILRAFTELHRGVVAQLQGEAAYQPVDDQVAKLLEGGRPAGRSVRELIAAYRAEKADGWSRSTLKSFEPIQRLLEDSIGDRQVSDITREDARMVQQLVRSLPLNLGKLKQFRSLTVPQAIEAAAKLGLPTISANTVNRGYLVHIAGVFNFARKEQWIAGSPFEGLRVHDPISPADKRDPFSVDQLKTLFRQAPWESRDHALARSGRFWVPLLCAFHGLRLAEAAGLLVDHVGDRDGIPVLLLKAYEGRALKTSSSRGLLPLHPELVRLGFLELVDDRRKANANVLFPDVTTNANGKVGAKLGEWFSKLVRERGLKGTKLGMHSFRHAFEDRLREAGLPHRTALALARRTERGSSGVYGHGLSIRSLAAAMEEVTYPGLDLSHLSPSASSVA